MENSGNTQQKRRKVSQEEVIAKLKDDGDFDNLRLKIIRKLKDNEELRSNIISLVKQSAVLHRPGAEKMKPRQLSDMIFEDIQDKVMNQVSDGVWEIIRSGDGMKSEIAETVQTVYNKLVHPEGPEGESSIRDMMPVKKEADNNGPMMVPASEAGDLDNGRKEPPGFTIATNHPNSHEERSKGDLTVQKRKEGLHQSENVMEPNDVGLGAHPGFHAEVASKEPCDDSDEDPEVPPGFG